MRAFFWKLINDKSGVTAIEYGLMRRLSRSPPSASWECSASISAAPSARQPASCKVQQKTSPDARRLVMSVGPSKPGPNFIWVIRRWCPSELVISTA